METRGEAERRGLAEGSTEGERSGDVEYVTIFSFHSGADTHPCLCHLHLVVQTPHFPQTYPVVCALGITLISRICHRNRTDV